jgi:hypothetical protein
MKTTLEAADAGHTIAPPSTQIPLSTARTTPKSGTTNKETASGTKPDISGGVGIGKNILICNHVEKYQIYRKITSCISTPSHFVWYYILDFISNFFALREDPG